MRRPIIAYFLGAITVLFVLCFICVVSRFIGFDQPHVPLWNGDEARPSGLIRPSNAGPAFGWNNQDIIDECLNDFSAMRLGDAELGPIYTSPEGGKIVIIFACPRDPWFRHVYDRAIAYVYDLRTQKLVAKFWVPLA